MWNRTENQIAWIDFYLLRHGLTASNREHRYLGRTDEGLCEAGIRQLLHLAKQWQSLPDVVFVSPMQRCRQSAGLLFPETPAVEIPKWREMDFGEFEGKNYEELNGNADYQAWIDSGGTKAFPGGEDRAEFISRTVAGMELAAEMLRNHFFGDSPKLHEPSPGRRPGQLQSAAAVVHGGTIMALLSHYVGGDYFDYQVKNGYGYHCLLDVRKPDIRIELVNEIV